MGEKPNENKVVMFPQLSKRLYEKGMNALKQKQFKEALLLFRQLLEIDSSYEEVDVGIVLCLLELGQLKEAKASCERLLKQDIGDYFNVLQIYITILIQLREYDEIVTILEAVLEEERIPPKDAEHFYQILDFSRRMSYEGTDVLEDDQGDDIYSLLEQLINTNHPAKQLYILQKLRNYKISASSEQLKQLLDEEQYHPVIKSFVLQLFIENQVDALFKVEKLQQSATFSLVELEERYHHSFRQKVLNLLDDYLGSENPSLFDVIKEVWERVWFTLFPFLPKPLNEALWACGIHKFGYDLHGIETPLDELVDQYHVDSIQLHDVIESIVQLEAISNIGSDS